MHLDNAHGWGRLGMPFVCAVGALVCALGLVGCGMLRVELCTRVQIRMLEELRTSEGTARAVMDPWTCDRNARRLHQLAQELQGLEGRDSTLRLAVEGYREQVESLAGSYARLAEAYENSDQLSPTVAERMQALLSRSVLEHAAALNIPRAQVQNACSGL